MTHTHIYTSTDTHACFNSHFATLTC